MTIVGWLLPHAARNAERLLDSPSPRCAQGTVVVEGFLVAFVVVRRASRSLVRSSCPFTPHLRLAQSMDPEGPYPPILHLCLGLRPRGEWLWICWGSGTEFCRGHHVLHELLYKYRRLADAFVASKRRREPLHGCYCARKHKRRNHREDSTKASWRRTAPLLQRATFWEQLWQKVRVALPGRRTPDLCRCM